MTPFLIAVLIAGAVFNVITWPTFLRRVARDPRATDAAGRRTRFYTVHLVLVVIALLLAALFGLGAVLLLTAPA